MNEKDQKYLDHILDCIDKTIHCCRDGRAEFEENYIIANASLHLLQLMAQSAKRLSDDTVSQLTETEIEKIIGFRNILVHEYLGGIDYDVVWSVIEIELPKLRNQILAVYTPKE